MYQPFDIGKRFRIVAAESSQCPDARINLIMQRGAFGSGEHETTISCLEFLENLPDLAGRQVLDLGSGTGILAIAALRLGAAGALCVDIEAAAVATARENCRLNQVSDRADHLVGTIENISTGPFDLVLANIYGDILLAVAGRLAALTAPGGDLLLSGILWEDNFAVRQAYRKHGCELMTNRMLPEFSSLWLKKARSG